MLMRNNSKTQSLYFEEFILLIRNLITVSFSTKALIIESKRSYNETGIYCNK